MAQTRDGALKTFMKRIGIPIDEYRRLCASGLRWCSDCKKMEPVENFGRDAWRADGLASRCLAVRRVEVRKCTKGRPSPMKGKHFGPNFNGGRKPGFVSEKRGVPRTLQERAKISASVRAVAKRGNQCHGYVDGRGVERLGIRYSAEYKRWRYEVYSRDRFTCQRCGDATGGNLHAHHILPFATFVLVRFLLANGITLCDVCHKEVHRGKGY